MIPTVIIKSSKFIPARVFTKKPKNVKTVSFKGLYYEYVQQKNLYSLEFLLAQLPYISNVFEMVFMKDASSDNWIGVFLNSTRKSVVIDNSVFAEQLRRYYYILNGRIAVINNVIDSDIEEIEFVSIEKLPSLIDPQKQKNRFVKSFIFLIIAIIFSATESFFSQSYMQETTERQAKYSQDMQRLYELTKKFKEKVVPDKQTQDLILANEVERLKKQ